MKVVLLSTRRLRAHMIDTTRTELGLDAADAAGLTVVSWNPPIGRLRVAQHLVVGPILSPAGRIRYARIDPIEPDPAIDPDRATLVDTAVEDTDPSSPDVSDGADAADAADALDVLIEDDGGDEIATADTDAPDGDAPGAPARSGSRRVANALKWRANRARLTVQRHPAAQRVGNSTKVRKLRNAVTPGGVAMHFALGCTQSAAVRRVVAKADLVVALDQNSHRAAWLLARRIAGPDVVVGVPAAARLIALNRDGGLS